LNVDNLCHKGNSKQLFLIRNCEISKGAVVIDESYVNELFMQQKVKEYGSDSLPGGGEGTAYKDL